MPPTLEDFISRHSIPQIKKVINFTKGTDRAIERGLNVLPGRQPGERGSRRAGPGLAPRGCERPESFISRSRAVGLRFPPQASRSSCDTSIWRVT
jgi:hypothetical protein